MVMCACLYANCVIDNYGDTDHFETLSTHA